MACDEIDLLQRLLQPRRSGLRDELVRSAVETVLPDAELPRDLARQRVLVGAAGHGLVEGGVEHAHVGNALGRLLASLDTLKVRRVVERRKRHAFANERLGRGGDLRGSGELVTAMHHAVADGVDLAKALYHAALRIAQHRHHLRNGLHVVLHRHLAYDLVAARLGVDEPRPGYADALHQPLAEHGLALHVEELELEGRRTTVYYEDLLNRFLHWFCSWVVW